jgi:glycerol-3-phosphate acyltransferase PlsY
MKKKIAILIIASGFLTGSITFAALYSNNDVTKCQSCNKNSCSVKTVPVEVERPLVAL